MNKTTAPTQEQIDSFIQRALENRLNYQHKHLHHFVWLVVLLLETKYHTTLKMYNYTYKITSLYLENYSMDLHTLTDLEHDWIGETVSTTCEMDSDAIRYLLQDTINEDLFKKNYPGVEVRRVNFVATSSPKVSKIAA